MRRVLRNGFVVLLLLCAGASVVCAGDDSGGEKEVLKQVASAIEGADRAVRASSDLRDAAKVQLNPVRALCAADPAHFGSSLEAMIDPLDRLNKAGLVAQHETRTKELDDAKKQLTDSCKLLADKKDDASVAASATCKSKDGAIEAEKKNLDGSVAALKDALTQVQKTAENGFKQSAKACGFSAVSGDEAAEALRGKLGAALPKCEEGLRQNKTAATAWPRVAALLQALGLESFDPSKNTVTDAQGQISSAATDLQKKAPQWLKTLATNATSEAGQVDQIRDQFLADDSVAPATAKQKVRGAIELSESLKGILATWTPIATLLKTSDDADASNLGKAAEEADNLGAAVRSVEAATARLREALAGDLDQFRVGETRLFYSTDVPRIIQALNPDAFLKGGNPTAAANAKAKRDALLDAETLAANAQMEVNAYQKQLGDLEEQKRQSVALLQNLRLSTNKLAVSLSAAQRKNTFAEQEYNTASAEAANHPDDAAKQKALQDATVKRDKAGTLLTNTSADYDRSKEQFDTEERKQAEREAASDSLSSKIKASQDLLVSAQAQLIQHTRDAAVAARDESDAFAAARDNAPYWYAPPVASSSDPFKRVELTGYPDTKVIRYRGTRADVDQVRQYLDLVDAPAPQSRLTLWTLEMTAQRPGSATKARKATDALNDALDKIDGTLSRIRGREASVEAALREAISEEVNSAACEAPIPAWAQRTAQLARLTAELAQRNKEIADSNEQYAQANTKAGQANAAWASDTKKLADETNSLAARTAENAKKGAELAGDAISLAKGMDDVAEKHQAPKTPVKSWTNTKNAIKRHKEAAEDHGDTALKTAGDAETNAKKASSNAMQAPPGASPQVTPQQADEIVGKAKTNQGESEKNAHDTSGNQWQFKSPYCIYSNALRAKAAVDLSKPETVERSVLPDPTRVTTLGEALLVASLAKSSAREKICAKFESSLNDHVERVRRAEVRRREAVKAKGQPPLETEPQIVAENLNGDDFPGLSRILGSACSGQLDKNDETEITSAQSEFLEALLHGAEFRKLKLVERRLDLVASALDAYDKARRVALNAPGAKLIEETRTQKDVTSRALKTAEDADTQAKKLWSDAKQGVERLTSELASPGRNTVKALKQSLETAKATLKETQAKADKAADVKKEKKALAEAASKAYSMALAAFDADSVQRENAKRKIEGLASSLPQLPARVSNQLLSAKPEEAKLLQNLAAEYARLNSCITLLAGAFGEPGALTNPNQQNAACVAAAYRNVESAIADIKEDTRPRVAAADKMLKEMIIAIEDDVDRAVVRPEVRSLRSELGGKYVTVGALQRTSVLSTNRMVARVDPHVTAQLELGQETDLISGAIQLAQIGLAFQTGGLLPILGAVNQMPREERPEIYGVSSGNKFEVTPIFDPSGQALRFKFDFVAQQRIEAPPGSRNAALPRVDRNTVNTEIQVGNLETREVARYEGNTALGLPTRYWGGLPFFKDIPPPVRPWLPVLGWFVRKGGTNAVVHQNVLFAQSTVYPTILSMVDLMLPEGAIQLAEQKDTPKASSTAAQPGSN